MPLKIVSAALTAAAILIGMTQVAGALDPKWPPGPYKYVVIEQNLKDALIEFGRNINVPVKVSDEVKGKLRGDLGSGSAEEFFKRLTESHGLVWYFDGSPARQFRERTANGSDRSRPDPADGRGVQALQARHRRSALSDSDHAGIGPHFGIRPAALYRARAPDAHRNGSGHTSGRGYQGAGIPRLELVTTPHSAASTDL